MMGTASCLPDTRHVKHFVFGTTESKLLQEQHWKGGLRPNSRPEVEICGWNYDRLDGLQAEAGCGFICLMAIAQGGEDHFPLAVIPIYDGAVLPPVTFPSQARTTREGAISKCCCNSQARRAISILLPLRLVEEDDNEERRSCSDTARWCTKNETSLRFQEGRRVVYLGKNRGANRRKAGLKRLKEGPSCHLEMDRSNCPSSTNFVSFLINKPLSIEARRREGCARLQQRMKSRPRPTSSRLVKQIFTPQRLELFLLTNVRFLTFEHYAFLECLRHTDSIAV